MKQSCVVPVARRMWGVLSPTYHGGQHVKVASDRVPVAGDVMVWVLLLDDVAHRHHTSFALQHPEGAVKDRV